MKYKKGSWYQVVRANDWIEVGEVVQACGDNRFMVKWEQTINLKNGHPTIVGYDARTRTYQLAVNLDCFTLYKPTPKEIVMNEDELNELRERVEACEGITFDEYKFLEDAGEAPDDYHIPEDDMGYHHVDNLTLCDVGEVYYLDADDFAVYHDDRGHVSSAHVDSLDNGRFFYCERSCEWWSTNRYSSMYIEDMGERWCYDRYHDDAYYCEDNDSYYSSSDEAPRSDRIPGYHTQSRRWIIPDGITLGVELEVYVDDAEEAYSNRCSEIIGERDGSLDDEHGVEFIGPPMNYDDYLKPRNPWAVTLEAINSAGVADEQDDGYGIHISVGRAALSRETQARFILFINCCQDFSEFIAQRKQNRWAEYDKKDPFHVQNMLSQGGGSWGSKYAATHVEGSRIEVRIFRSVTDPALFQKNIDYVMSAIEYADSSMFVEDMMSVSTYLAWLSKQDKYQALKDFIGKSGESFAEEDARRKELQQNGFIIQSTNQSPTI